MSRELEKFTSVIRASGAPPTAAKSSNRIYGSAVGKTETLLTVKYVHVLLDKISVHIYLCMCVYSTG